MSIDGLFFLSVAHVHLGRNAVDALVDALGAVRGLAEVVPELPQAVERTVAEAKALSEAESGEGVADPDRQCPARLDTDARHRVTHRTDPRQDLSWRILECTEPSWTNPKEDIVRAVCGNAAVIGGRDVAGNLRAGFSDARFYWREGVPSVVYGVAPNGTGGADEYATVEDLKAVLAVHTLAGFDYLKGG